MVDPLLKVGNRVTVKRYQNGRLTLHATGVVMSVGDVGFRLKGSEWAGKSGMGFDSCFAHDPTGRDVERPIEQVIEQA